MSKGPIKEIAQWVKISKRYPKILATTKGISNFLTNYNLGTLLGYPKIPRGFANDVIALKTTKGKFVLKIVGRNNPYRVRYEVDLLNYLKGLPIPKPIKTKSKKYLINYNQTNKAFIYRYLPGQPVVGLNESMVKQVGRFLGKMHSQTKNFESSIKRIEWYNISQGALKEMVKVKKKMKNKRIRDSLIYIENNLLRYLLPKSLPQGAMHIDFKPANTLFQRGKLTGVVDFDNAYNGPLLLDLTHTMMWFCSKEGKFNIKHALAIYHSYQRMRNISKQEKKYFFEALHYAFLTHMLIDIYLLVFDKLPLDYIKWGIPN